MDTTHEAGTKQGLLRRWPVTTIAGLGGVASLTALLATSSPESSVEVLVTKDVEVEARAMSREELAAPERAAGSAAKPGSALRGPKEGSPAGGATAVGHGVDDVWGGLSGSAIGEAYGVGGLGLVGTGRGGGGTGEGTIGLGTIGLAGKGRYDSSLQSGVLTVGTVDDNADPAAFKKALRRMAAERRSLGIPEDMWQLTPRERRHDERPGGLDVALVVDTTGSMGDELEYLKVELRGIALEISRDFPDVDQRWGLVVYRDDGDMYVTQTADFQGIEAFVAALGRQEAGGGGDTPEAMDVAMVESSRLAWRADDATARVVFLVADAPTHEGSAAKQFARSVREHRDAGTAIYPVGASGVDVQAEAQLRLAAKATGGQYIFLTDHSGIGGLHAAPKVDQYKVETLNTAMTRMIRKELGSARGGPRSKPAQPPPRAAEVVAPAPVVEPVFTPMVEPAPMPMPMLVAVAVATEPPSMWEELKLRLAAHLLFASSIAVLVFAAMGVDSFLARRRRMVLRDRSRRG
jgi:hypothetical protein